MKDFYRLITTRLLLLVAFFMASTGLQAQPENILVNGDFSSSYSGWTPSAYVYYYYGVSNFDIDGPGPKASSPAFWGRAGSGSYIVNLSQTVSLTAGRTYVVSADIASIIQNASYNMVLTYAGIFELSIGGTIVASHDFGPSIQRDNPLYGSLSGTYVAPSTGDFVLNIKIYKPQYTANTYHYMYVDNVILNWQAPQVNLAVTTDPSGAGTVDKTPEKVTYNQGETVQLTANPEFGYMFSNWSGDVASSNNPLDLLMDDHKTVTAHFDPANVLVKFLNSSDVGISGGVVEYYDRGWQNAGITDEKGELRFNYDGRRSRLNFRLTYNGEIMTQNNVSFMEGPVIFQLEGTTVLLLSSTGDGLPGGLAEVFNGSWTELGTTDENGEVKAGLPSGYYSIRMTYEGMTETKSNLDISSPVIFQTLNMVVRLEHAMVGGIPDGEVMFQAPAKAWSAFGITDNSGNTSKELLPGVYDFNMTYQSSTEEMNGVDISVTNPLVFEPAPGSEISYITESKIANPDGVTNHFAWELASAGISDEFAIVGAEWDKGPNTGYYNIGTAYIFRKVEGEWEYQTKLYASDWTNASELFGYSVDIEGDYAVIGAPTKSNVGAVYVFHWNGNTWVQQAKLTPPVATSGGYFGNSVSISGDRILVGHSFYSTYRGAIHFYTLSGSSWTLEQSIIGTQNYQYLGRDVDISGNRAIVGTGSNVYFYEKNTNWALVKSVYGTSNSNFGYDVAISGDYAVVGAKLANSYQGRAYVYYRNAGIWNQQAELSSPAPYYNERFGQDVDISGDKVVVGNITYISSVEKEGAAYLFSRNGSAWTFDQKFQAADGTINNHFGKAVAISENDVLVGATGADNYKGAAYFYSMVSVTIPELTPKSGKVASVDSGLIEEFGLYQNYPNPFSTNTKIRFKVKEAANTNLKVYNAFGQEVTVLYSGEAKPGVDYEFNFDGTGMPAGLYIYRLENGNNSASKRMLLHK